jgi:hypothetical protein
VDRGALGNGAALASVCRPAARSEVRVSQAKPNMRGERAIRRKPMNRVQIVSKNNEEHVRCADSIIK